MTLVAPGICRFTVNAVFAGEPIANILDMQVDTTGSVIDRDEAINGIAGDILNNWDDHVRAWLPDDITCESVSWVDLDSAGGSTGSRSTTSSTTWPAVGGDTTAPQPASVAMLVRKQVAGARGRRSGRMYLPGVLETATDSASPNHLNSITVSHWNTQMDDLLSGINDGTTGIYDTQRQLVVVHTRLPDPTAPPVYNGFSVVESLTVDPLLATQRRRLR